MSVTVYLSGSLSCSFLSILLSIYIKFLSLFISSFSHNSSFLPYLILPSCYLPFILHFLLYNTPSSYPFLFLLFFPPPFLPFIQRFLFPLSMALSLSLSFPSPCPHPSVYPSSSAPALLSVPSIPLHHHDMGHNTRWGFLLTLPLQIRMEMKPQRTLSTVSSFALFTTRTTGWASRSPLFMMVVFCPTRPSTNPQNVDILALQRL